MNGFPYKKLIVVGTTGSGKSTLAEQLAGKLGGDFIELDALYWGPNWTPAENDLFRSRVEEATLSPCWVVAGNYGRIRALTWPLAEAIIWLDYSFLLIFWRLTVRTFRRAITQEELWNGNRERFWWHFKLWSDESLFHWLFKTYWRRKREYPVLFAQPKYSHLKIIRFKKPRETTEWLQGI
jgi:adenylate kinase family enzyme